MIDDIIILDVTWEDMLWQMLSCCGLSFFTSAEREVKDLRRSGMYQSYNFLTRLGKQSLYVFGSIRLFDEVRAELVRDISRSLRFL